MLHRIIPSRETQPSLRYMLSRFKDWSRYRANNQSDPMFFGGRFLMSRNGIKWIFPKQAIQEYLDPLS